MMSWSQIGFQDAQSPIQMEFIVFHDFVMVVLVLILSMASYILLSTSLNLWVNLSLLESQSIECIWTLVPALILVGVSVPSLALLYLVEDQSSTIALTFKVTGSQWYWTYEYQDEWNLGSVSGREEGSYMQKEEGLIRLLEVDSRLFVPFRAPLQLLIGSSDVLHSWAIPSLGAKADACPGRLNQMKLMVSMPGVFYGQCSEICGVNHSFMPCVLEAVSLEDYFEA